MQLLQVDSGHTKVFEAHGGIAHDVFIGKDVVGPVWTPGPAIVD